MKQAKETADDMFLERESLLQVGFDGVPVRQISLNLDKRDMNLFWKKKEKILLVLILVCSIIFSLLAVFYL